MNHETPEKVLFRDESYAIQGAVYEVYREMGLGFLEAVYQECLAIEFSGRKIPFTVQKDLSLVYKGERLQQIYRPDFVCFGKIIVEIKAAKGACAGTQGAIIELPEGHGMAIGTTGQLRALSKGTD